MNSLLFLSESRNRKLNHNVLVTRLLDFLGIEYRKVSKRSFWLANEDRLHYIYSDLQTEGREALARYHPDRPDGDEETFKCLSVSLSQARRSFVKKIGSSEERMSQMADQENRSERRKHSPKSLAKYAQRYKKKPILEEPQLEAPKKDRRVFWTAEAVTKLRQYAALGWSSKDAAQALGRPYADVKNKSRYSGISFSSRPWKSHPISSWSEEKYEKLRQMRKDCKTIPQIAAELGYSQSLVHIHLARLKIERSHRLAFTENEDAIMRRFIKEGRLWKEIFAALPHRSQFSIRSRGIKLGLVGHRVSYWSKFEDEQLRNLCAQKKTDPEMALALRRSVHGIAQRRKHLDLKKLAGTGREFVPQKQLKAA